MSTLHDRIMNIVCDGAPLQEEMKRIAYKEGHRDARHAAAELAAEQDALVAQLADALNLLLNDKGPDFIKSSSWNAARSALAAYQESQA